MFQDNDITPSLSKSYCPLSLISPGEYTLRLDDTVDVVYAFLRRCRGC